MEDFIPRIPLPVTEVRDRLESAGHTAVLAGGCVRDLWLGLDPEDHDIATSALPSEVAMLFPRTLPTGLGHGTVTVHWKGMAVEITTFRSESGYSDSRRPDRVEFGVALEHDLARRDFTCNAMAWSPALGLVDPFDGRGDLADRCLRTVGVARDRFGEDALRLLRAIRFACRLDLRPTPDLLSAAAGTAGSLARISRERVTEEWRRIVRSPHPGRLVDFAGTGVASASFADLPVPVDDVRLCRLLADWLRPGMPEAVALAALADAAGTASPSGRPDAVSPDDLSLRVPVRLHAAMAGIRTAQGLWEADAGPGADPDSSSRRIAAFLARRLRRPPDFARRETLWGIGLLHLEGRLQEIAGTPAGPPDALLGAARRLVRCQWPISRLELPVGGHDLQAMGLVGAGRIAAALDRLLEAVVADPSLNRRAALLSLLEVWYNFP